MHGFSGMCAFSHWLYEDALGAPPGGQADQARPSVRFVIATLYSQSTTGLAADGARERKLTNMEKTMHADIDEIMETYAGLNDQELVNLRKAARRHMSGTRFTEPCDLIHETLHALMCSDRRHWPKHVPFQCFMAETMRSVAHADRKRKENKLDCGHSVDALADLGDWRLPSRRSVEAELEQHQPGRIAVRAAEQARASLEHDGPAQFVIDALLAGFEPRETCEHFGWDMNKYRAARQRALLQIRKNLPPGLG